MAPFPVSPVGVILPKIPYLLMKMDKQVSIGRGRPSCTRFRTGYIESYTRQRLRANQLEELSQDVNNHSRFLQILDKPTRVRNLPKILREHRLQSLVHILSDGSREQSVPYIHKWGILGKKVLHSSTVRAISTVWKRSILHEMLMS